MILAHAGIYHRGRGTQESLLRNEYLAAENRILRAKIKAYGQKSHPRLQKSMTGSDLRASGCCCGHVADIGSWSEKSNAFYRDVARHLPHSILIWMTRVTQAKAESFEPQF
jgi:hypothetical protein